MTLQDRYRELVEEAREAFSTDFNYLLDVAKISRRIKSRSRSVESIK